MAWLVASCFFANWLHNRWDFKINHYNTNEKLNNKISCEQNEKSFININNLALRRWNYWKYFTLKREGKNKIKLEGGRGGRDDIRHVIYTLHSLRWSCNLDDTDTRIMNPPKLFDLNFWRNLEIGKRLILLKYFACSNFFNVLII